MEIKKKKIIPVTFFVAVAIIFTVILTSCMGIGPFGSRQFEEEEQGIEIFTVERGDILQSIAATGSVDSKAQNSLSPGVTGKILTAPEKGDTFSKGDILIEIDPSEVEDQLIQIEMDIENSKSSLRTAQLNYQKALDANHIAVQLAELNTQQAELLTESAFVSLETANRSADLSLESAQRALEEAKEILEIAKDEGTATDMDIKQYKSNIESAEEKVESAKNSARSSQSQAESSYEQSLISQSTNYWNNLSNLQSAESQITSTQENIKQILRFQHNILPEGSDDFSIRENTQILEMASSVSETLSVTLGGIAAISLLVGGIGIMNIMFVSVTERTKEIGIRKAIGAKNRDIMIQFLTESVILSFMGGVIGVGLAYLLTRLLSSLITSIITATPVILALSVSTFIGLVFGIFPAMRAARMHPVDSLRYE